MLTYNTFLDYNEGANICFKVFLNKIEVNRPEDCIVKDFYHNFDDCLKMDRIDSLVLNITLPKKTSYTVNINYREDRNIDRFDQNKNKKWQYTIKTKHGNIISENTLDDFEEIIRNSSIDTKDKIVEILRSIKYRNIINI